MCHRRVPNPKVVERDLNPQLLQLAQELCGAGGVFHQEGLGHLKLDQARRYVGLLKDICHTRHETIVLELL